MYGLAKANSDGLSESVVSCNIPIPDLIIFIELFIVLVSASPDH